MPFHILKPANRHAGWPDRIVQLPLGSIVWVEFKVTTLRPDGCILLDTFTANQAAFMYKWARNSGLCFILVGVLNKNKNLISYTVVRPFLYKEWMNVNRTLYPINKLEITTLNMEDIKDWFQELFVRKDRYAPNRRKEFTNHNVT